MKSGAPLRVDPFPTFDHRPTDEEYISNQLSGMTNLNAKFI
jgi:hypothetical protein